MPILGSVTLGTTDSFTTKTLVCVVARMLTKGDNGRLSGGAAGYPGTMVPRTEEQERRARLQRAQYPWSDDSTYQLPAPATDSSASDTAYHLPYYNQTLPRQGRQSPPYTAPFTPYSVETWRSSYRKPQERSPSHAARLEAYSFPHCASAFSLPLVDAESERCLRPAPVMVAPTVVSDAHVIGACGGHCPGFEYVCYYILQIILVVGILTGISLCIAGVVLCRSNRGNLGVLVYIGSLSSMVCALLLGVQCCARREIRQRRKRTNNHIPMMNMQETSAPAYPLLQTTLPHSVYRPTTIPEREATGVPWWRRNQDTDSK